MRKKILIWALLIVGVLIVLSLFGEKEEPFDISNLNLPESRSFYIGFPYQPHDWSEEAFEQAFERIGRYGDLFNNYLDDGVPWLEAFEGKPYHPNFEADIQRRLNHINENQKMILILSPLDIDRKSLAKYRGEAEKMERPGIWKNKTFDDLDVIKAYFNYCRDMIDRFQPDYMAYVAEADDQFTDVDSAEFQKFLVFVKEVYTTLKKEYPDILIFIEFFLSDEKHMKERKEVTKALLPYTDIYAVSTYPYYYEGIGGDFNNLPKDWFSRIRNFTDKPFAVLETGWLAENYVTKEHGLLIIGKEKWQAGYVKFLLEESNKLDAEFVSWYVSRDIDQLWDLIKGVEGAFGLIWRDTGLIDDDGNPRQGLKIWDAWLELPKR